METNTHFKTRKPVGLVYAQRQCETSKSGPIDDNSLPEQVVASSQDTIPDHQFSLSDDLKKVFQNELQARYVGSDESDLSVVK
jgi:hypothetical protein